MTKINAPKYEALQLNWCLAVAILQGAWGGKAPPTIASAPPRLLLIKVVLVVAIANFSRCALRAVYICYCESVTCPPNVKFLDTPLVSCIAYRQRTERQAFDLVKHHHCLRSGTFIWL